MRRGAAEARFGRWALSPASSQADTRGKPSRPAPKP